MTELDKALEVLQDNPQDHKAQSGFYDLFLNSGFYVPTIRETFENEDGSTEENAEVPLILENDDTDFLVFFDEQQRLNDWAEEDAPCVKLPGHVITEMSTPELHWALNIGTDYFKTFVPEEIGWLKDVVKRCKEEEGAGEAPVS